MHTVERLIAFLGVNVEDEIDILQKTASNRNLLRTNDSLAQTLIRLDLATRLVERTKHNTLQRG